MTQEREYSEELKSPLETGIAMASSFFQKRINWLVEVEGPSRRKIFQDPITGNYDQRQLYQGMLDSLYGGEFTQVQDYLRKFIDYTQERIDRRLKIIRSGMGSQPDDEQYQRAEQERIQILEELTLVDQERMPSAYAALKNSLLSAETRQKYSTRGSALTELHELYRDVIPAQDALKNLQHTNSPSNSELSS